MEFNSRFVFHGNASAIGGRIVRRDDKPVDIIIETGCESSLMPVGGRSRTQVDGKKFEDLVSFRSASTLAEGRFEDHQRAYEASLGGVDEHELTAITDVSADVSDVVVGIKPKLTVERLRVALNSRSPRGSGQPSIKPVDTDNQTIIQGVRIDDYELLVDLNTSMYQQCDTHAKLLAAADDPAFVAEHGHCLYMRSGVDRRTPPERGRLVTSHHMIHGTIVNKLRWKDDKAYPGSIIDHNSVAIPEFGRIFFGELLIADRSRRLTMMRVKLGSPIGGEVAAASTEPNGVWS